MRRAAVLAALAICLGAASDAAAEMVVISTDGVQPRRAHVGPGALVRWENTSPAAVRIQSLGRPRFQSLDVEAGRSGQRRFNRVGRYRYTIPGTVGEAVVIVGVRLRRPRPRGRGCDRRDVFLYDAVVNGTKSFTETSNPRFEREGEFSISYGYRAAYRGLPVVVQHECETRLVEVNTRGRGTGTLSNYKWADSDRFADPDAGSTQAPCGFELSVDALGATFEIKDATFVSRGRGSFLSVRSRVTPDQRDALSELLAARRGEVCDKGGQPNTSVFDGPAGHESVSIFDQPYRVGGGELFPPSTVLNGDFDRRGRGAQLRNVIAGRSFSVASGERTYDETGFQTRVVAKASMRIRFTRRRG
jgi:hypothetical protein